MSRPESREDQITISLISRPGPRPIQPAEALRCLGVDPSSPDRLTASLPFSGRDLTCGVENELQAVVLGSRSQVDLPQTIERSNYYQNIVKRLRRGELPRRVVADLEHWLADNPDQVWENSWVRVPLDLLCAQARSVLDRDLLADKKNPALGRRSDAGHYSISQNGREHLRIPVSYLLKLALTDFAGRRGGADDPVGAYGLELAEHYLSDNTSPELYSFHLVRSDGRGGPGPAAANETARRFLLTQLLVQYAGRRFGLIESGQKVQVYFAPHPPVRQKALNDLISDSFYRDLFMNPCLSGWDRGEDKHRYMHLCHQVLSRAQLGALSRLRDAGLIARNLVVLPSASNISLANNGTHVSLGSLGLSSALDGAGALMLDSEKHLGDLVIKFVEHFLPLFVGTYSAAPYRLDFADFHPEKVLSFLPYELDYTHLRMIWRRWKKKARLNTPVLGLRLTPFGPPKLDAWLSRILNLAGDLVPDYRLLDYLVAVMSTDQSPALDGRPGNQARLKQDLAQMGVFDPRMPIYLLYRQRLMTESGFAGFEGRHYSLFGGLGSDLAPAIGLQGLVTALAFHLIATGRLTHAHVPDKPEIESERRQVFFGAAIGLPTFFVRADTRNLVLKTILAETDEVRPSRRYPGWLRVKQARYRQALVGFLKREGAALIESQGLTEVLADLEARLADPVGLSAHGRLVRSILGGLGVRSAFKVDAFSFNRAAENFYRQGLRQEYLREAWAVLERDFERSWPADLSSDPGFRQVWRRATSDRDALDLIRSLEGPVLSESAGLEELDKLISLSLLSIYRAAQVEKESPAARPLTGATVHEHDRASLY
ncbi:MAG: hypothetical protein AB1641_02185 [Thermodesulfobacteriota bacterium]